MQGKSAFTRSRSGLPIGDEISLSPGVHSVADIPLHDQFSYGNDYALKVFPCLILTFLWYYRFDFTFVTVSPLF